MGTMYDFGIVGELNGLVTRMCYMGVQRWVLRNICNYILVSLFFVL